MRKILYIFVLSICSTSYADTHGVNYPARAEMLRITGYAKVLYDVGSDGRVYNIRFIESEPKNVFEKEIVKGMCRWVMPEKALSKDNPHEFRFSKE